MYVTRLPAEELRDFVDTYWFVSCAPGETTDLSVDVYADGRADLVFFGKTPYTRSSRLGSISIDYSNIDAQRTTPVQITQRGEVNISGVRLLPGGAAAFSNTSISTLTDRVVPLSEIIRSAVPERVATIAQLGDDTDAKAQIVNEILIESLECSDEDRNRILAIQGLGNSPTESVKELSDRFSASIRTIERIFDRLVGLTPKFYLRIARFQNALRQLMDDDHIDLAELAQSCGYYDQSHLVREFHELAGGVPREYKGYMPDEWRDFAPNVVRYADDLRDPSADYNAGDERHDEIET